MTKTNKDHLEADDVVREMGYGEMPPELREQWRARETDMRVQARINAVESAKLQSEKEERDIFQMSDAQFTKHCSSKGWPGF
jgi:hypothetical protein